jgi:hypothetical protein
MRPQSAPLRFNGMVRTRGCPICIVPPHHDDNLMRLLQEAEMILIPVVLVIGGLLALVLYLDKRAPF